MDPNAPIQSSSQWSSFNKIKKDDKPSQVIIGNKTKKVSDQTPKKTTPSSIPNLQDNKKDTTHCESKQYSNFKKASYIFSFGVLWKLDKRKEKQNKLKDLKARYVEAKKSGSDMRKWKAYEHLYKSSSDKKGSFIKEHIRYSHKATKSINDFIRGSIDVFKKIIGPFTGSSASAATVQAAQASVSIGSVITDAVGIGIGALFIPMKFIDVINSFKEARKTKMKHDYAKVYISKNEPQKNEKLNIDQENLIAAAKNIKNQHRYIDAYLDTADAIQGLFSTCISTASTLVAAVSPLLGPVGLSVSAAAGTFTLGVATSSLGSSLGLIAFKKAKKAFKWSNKMFWKDAATHPKNFGALKVKAKVIKNIEKAENKKLTREEKRSRANEIDKRTQEIIQQKLIKKDHKTLINTTYSQLLKEQSSYFDDSSENAELNMEGYTVQFLKHFGISEDIMKIIIDANDPEIAKQLLSQNIKSGINNLEKQGIVKETMIHNKIDKKWAQTVYKKLIEEEKDYIKDPSDITKLNKNSHAFTFLEELGINEDTIKDILTMKKNEQPAKTLQVLLGKYRNDASKENIFENYKDIFFNQ